MKKHDMMRTGGLAIVVAVGAASAALSHTDTTDKAKERMVAMPATGDAVKTVTPMMSGEAAFDARVVRDPQTEPMERKSDAWNRGGEGVRGATHGGSHLAWQ